MAYHWRSQARIARLTNKCSTRHTDHAIDTDTRAQGKDAWRAETRRCCAKKKWIGTASLESGAVRTQRWLVTFELGLLVQSQNDPRRAWYCIKQTQQKTHRPNVQHRDTESRAEKAPDIELT
jgi:hypothetical protein